MTAARKPRKGREWHVDKEQLGYISHLKSDCVTYECGKDAFTLKEVMPPRRKKRKP